MKKLFLPTKQINIAFLGASTDCGFINKFPMGTKISPFAIMVLLLKLGLHLLFSIPACLSKLTSLGFTKFNVKQIFSFNVAFFFLKNYSVHRNSLEYLVKIFEEQYNIKVKVDDYSIPLQGYYNLHINDTLSEMKKRNINYDFIIVHLGGNDVIQAVDNELFYHSVVKVKTFLEYNFPSSGLMVLNVVDLNALLNDATGEKTAGYVWGMPFKVKTIRKLYMLLNPLQRKAKELNSTVHEVIVSELYRKNAIIENVFHSCPMLLSIKKTEMYDMPEHLHNIDGLHISEAGNDFLSKKFSIEVLSLIEGRQKGQ